MARQVDQCRATSNGRQPAAHHPCARPAIFHPPGDAEPNRGLQTMSYKPAMPEIHVNVYGTGRDKAVPDAARFDKGTSTVEGAQEAADAVRNHVPGDAER
jgi:hypothetical protein